MCVEGGGEELWLKTAISKSKNFETKEHLPEQNDTCASNNQHWKLTINQVTFCALELREKAVNFTLEQRVKEEEKEHRS